MTKFSPTAIKRIERLLKLENCDLDRRLDSQFFCRFHIMGNRPLLIPLPPELL
jgi:hypothetical protein